MNKKRCNTLLPLVQLLPAVAAAAAVLFACPVLSRCWLRAGKLTAVVEQPAEAASVEAEEEALPSCPMPMAYTSALPGATAVPSGCR